MRPRCPITIVLAVAPLALLACGASNKANCDPATIAVKDRCYWQKEQACDAIGCVPPDECVVVEGQPASVTCKKQ